jgi:hypothetical protein
MNQFEFSQNVWAQVRELGALCATPGIDEETLKVSNALIRDLLAAVKPQIQKMTATASGIVL